MFFNYFLPFAAKDIVLIKWTSVTLFVTSIMSQIVVNIFDVYRLDLEARQFYIQYFWVLEDLM